LPKNLGWLAALSLLSEVCVAVGDASAAEAMYGLLLPYRQRAVVFDWSLASFGSAARYLGLLAGVMGRLDDAASHFEEALAANARMGARPYLAHTQHEFARMLLARGGPGDAERAAALLGEALETARELGMAGVAEAASALLEETPAEAALPASVGVFRREGEYWTVGFGGDSFRLKDAKGLRHLARLLADPGTELFAADLAMMLDGAAPAATKGRPEPGLEASGLGDAGELLDPQAKAAYKRRLDELRDELEEAESWNDAARASKAREEIDFLARELSSAVGLGGRDRKAASAADRARVAVTKAIRSAIQRISANSPSLGQHLDTTVRTGTFCSYAPDPRVPIAWEL